MLPALFAGLAFVALAVAMASQFSQRTFSSDLLRKLPKDSTVALVSRVSELDNTSLRQVTDATGIQRTSTSAYLNALSADTHRETIKRAVADEFALGRTTHGSVAIFTVRDAGALAELQDSLKTKLVGPQKTERDGLTFLSGTLADTAQVVTLALDGGKLYIASNPELILGARQEENGFTANERFNELSKKLPPAKDAYIFFNPAPVKSSLGLDVPLFGAGIANHKENLEISMHSASVSSTSVGLDETSGKLLAPADLASVSLQGKDVQSYLRLLEEQRAETSLPKVVSLQNGIANLSRTLGVDVEREFVGAASGQFMYSRFIDPQNATQWFGLVEFPSAEEANAKTTEILSLAASKVKIPVRKQIVRVLPDGSQSREVISEGQEPLALEEQTIEGRKVTSMTLPGGFGPMLLVVHDKYLFAASSDVGISRLFQVTRREGQAAHSGELTVRIKLADGKRMLADPDAFEDWILATRPARGEFRLDKSNGVLSGGVYFQE